MNLVCLRREFSHALPLSEIRKIIQFTGNYKYADRVQQERSGLYQHDLVFVTVRCIFVCAVARISHPSKHEQNGSSMGQWIFTI